MTGELLVGLVVEFWVAVFVCYGIHVTVALFYHLTLEHHVENWNRKRGRKFAAALRQQCVEGLHHRKWDCWDEWEVEEDQYNSETARHFRRMGELTGMRWASDFWKQARKW